MAQPLMKNSGDMTEMSNQSKNVHDTRISDAVMDNGENYGSEIRDLVLRNDKGGKGVIIGETVGKISNLNSSAGLVIFENKRRRTEDEFLLGQSDSNMGHNKLLMDTNMETVNKEGNYVMDHDLGRTEEILEEENRKEKVEQVKVELGFGGSFVVEASGHSGGLAMLWKNQDDGTLLSYSKNHVDMEIHLEGNQMFRLTSFLWRT
ncbi:hypothetical protein POM88_024516 [Heracleum sosnowskyi]|uniref:Uncharacterized protein n=1 Tax=Heracleum sosnowskyi TaxID=360622 RepID=A0AAD8I486_9APIA|nr:hypothetical protein POM88_024516 [Heracleum sosnowskyi]